MFVLDALEGFSLRYFPGKEQWSATVTGFPSLGDSAEMFSVSGPAAVVKSRNK